MQIANSLYEFVNQSQKCARKFGSRIQKVFFVLKVCSHNIYYMLYCENSVLPVALFFMCRHITKTATCKNEQTAVF